MRSVLLRLGGMLVLAGVASCADSIPVEPTALVARPTLMSATKSAPSDENVLVSPLLADMNAQLGAMGLNVRISKAELLLDAAESNAKSATLIIANDRARGIGAEWVKGDPRREFRIGVNYAVTAGMAPKVLPQTVGPNGTFPAFSLAQVDQRLEEGVDAWRNVRCSSKPITRETTIAPGTNPDLLDDLFLGRPIGNWVPAADIIQGGWLPGAFFRAVAGGTSGNNIIGITFTFTFIDNAGNATDIDGNGMDDIGLAEIYYNARFAWTMQGAPGMVDFYSIITHETGHGLGLGHFGKVFVTKKDRLDGVQIADIKYAPRAMMNALYVTGRSELRGTDNSSFCQLWAGNN